MARSLILYIAVSIDGYIADREGAVDWLRGERPEKDSDYGYADFIAAVDTVILGGTTYRQIAHQLSPGNWPYRGMECYVLTHRDACSREEITFVDGDLRLLVEKLKARPGRDIWLCGGADLVRQALEADLIDEYRLTIIPVLLGGGTRLFTGRHGLLPCQLTETRAENGVLTCVYTRRTGEVHDPSIPGSLTQSQASSC